MRTIRNKVSSRDLLTIAEAKEYLEEVLFSLGTANVDRDVTSEVREMDCYISLLVLTLKPAPNAVL
ncbi:hypothetical protein [Microcoleus sp. OTE_8_concoct_300]|uniref:hypothetical protein n=1 Tax=Microcoleus sp. OTE_8_concoct_300 TaxID=2964710 RepID=UPI00403F01F4